MPTGNAWQRMNPKLEFNVELIRTSPTERDYLNDVEVKVNGVVIHLEALLVYRSKGRQQADANGTNTMPRLTFRLKFIDPTIKRNKDFPALSKAIRDSLKYYL